MEPIQYFSQVIAAYYIHFFDLSKILSEKNIIPSNTRGYRVSEIKNALDEAFGINVAIVWWESNRTGLKFFKEARFVMRSTKSEFIDHHRHYFCQDSNTKSLGEDDILYFPSREWDNIDIGKIMIIYAF